jgi:hypothetical protein
MSSASMDLCWSSSNQNDEQSKYAVEKSGPNNAEASNPQSPEPKQNNDSETPETATESKEEVRQRIKEREEQELGMVIWVWVPDNCRILDLMDMDTGIIFYPWVSLVSDPNRDEYGTDIFSHPRVTRWIPDNLLPL